jgi:2-amino-4-hydroxy-6-hydroxymethyldihydropteridine diphosphokinase
MGSNLGDRVGNLVAALGELEAVPGIDVSAVSRVYESEPWGVTDQPAFANAVVAVDTTLGAEALLSACKGIEASLGRLTGVRYGPRAIDLDLLLFGDETVETAGLTVPHPRLLERDFVVTPLLEIESGVTLPGGVPVTRDDAIHGRVTGILAEWPAPVSGLGAGNGAPTG